MMKVNPTVFDQSDRHVRAGIHKGKACYYKSAIYSCLLQFKPKFCLEIGTHKGGSAAIFQRYFNEHRPDGVLVTTDVRKWPCSKNILSDTRIKRLIVAPHVTNVAADGVNLEKWREIMDNSTKHNVSVLRKNMDELSISEFDFCFIDGNHREESYRRDIEIVWQLTSPSCRVLLDDVKEGQHECRTVYENETKKVFEHYEFEDWPVFIGCALIWRKKSGSASN